MAAKKKARRTTHRSSSGKKVYAKRNRKGQIKDVQSYKRASAADQRRRAKVEGKKRKKVARKAAKSTRSAKKAAPRKVARPVAATPKVRPAPAPKPAPKPTPIVPLAPIEAPVATGTVEQGNLGFEASNDAMADKPAN
jgi:hypothetical protein